MDATAFAVNVTKAPPAMPADNVKCHHASLCVKEIAATTDVVVLAAPVRKAMSVTPVFVSRKRQKRPRVSLHVQGIAEMMAVAVLAASVKKGRSVTKKALA